MLITLDSIINASRALTDPTSNSETLKSVDQFFREVQNNEIINLWRSLIIQSFDQPQLTAAAFLTSRCLLNHLMDVPTSTNSRTSKITNSGASIDSSILGSEIAQVILHSFSEDNIPCACMLPKSKLHETVLSKLVMCISVLAISNQWPDAITTLTQWSNISLVHKSLVVAVVKGIAEQSRKIPRDTLILLTDHISTFGDLLCGCGCLSVHLYGGLNSHDMFLLKKIEESSNAIVEFAEAFGRIKISFLSVESVSKFLISNEKFVAVSECLTQSPFAYPFRQNELSYDIRKSFANLKTQSPAEYQAMSFLFSRTQCMHTDRSCSERCPIVVEALSGLLCHAWTHLLMDLEIGTGLCSLVGELMASETILSFADVWNELKEVNRHLTRFDNHSSNNLSEQISTSLHTVVGKLANPSIIGIVSVLKKHFLEEISGFSETSGENDDDDPMMKRRILDDVIVNIFILADSMGLGDSFIDFLTNSLINMNNLSSVDSLAELAALLATSSALASFCGGEETLTLKFYGVVEAIIKVPNQGQYSSKKSQALFVDVISLVASIIKDCAIHLGRANNHDLCLRVLQWLLEPCQPNRPQLPSNFVCAIAAEELIAFAEQSARLQPVADFIVGKILKKKFPEPKIGASLIGSVMAVVRSSGNLDAGVCALARCLLTEDLLNLQDELSFNQVIVVIQSLCLGLTASQGLAGVERIDVPGFAVLIGQVWERLKCSVEYLMISGSSTKIPVVEKSTEGDLSDCCLRAMRATAKSIQGSINQPLNQKSALEALSEIATIVLKNRKTRVIALAADLCKSARNTPYENAACLQQLREACFALDDGIQEDEVLAWYWSVIANSPLSNINTKICTRALRDLDRSIDRAVINQLTLTLLPVLKSNQLGTNFHHKVVEVVLKKFGGWQRRAVPNVKDLIEASGVGELPGFFNDATLSMVQPNIRQHVAECFTRLRGQKFKLFLIALHNYLNNLALDMDLMPFFEEAQRISTVNTQSNAIIDLS